MKVLVTGSYRRREASDGYGFRSEEAFGENPWTLFKETAFSAGKGVAEAGHLLVLSWSYSNVESQLGIKIDRRTGRSSHSHPESHPYWETAEYHALMGFISIVEQHPEEARPGRIVIDIAGEDERYETLIPFPDPGDATRGLEACSPMGRGSVIGIERFPDGHRPLAGHIAAGMIVLRPSKAGSKSKRRDMVVELAGEADTVILLGGGYATRAAAMRAAERGVLFAVAPFATPPFEFGTVEREAIAMVPGLRLAMVRISQAAGGDPVRLARLLPKRLPWLKRRTGPVRGLLARYAFKWIIAIDALVIASAVLSGLDAWHAAQAKELSAAQGVIILAWGLAAFGALIAASAAAAYNTITDKAKLVVWTLAIGAQAVVAAGAAMGTTLAFFEAAKSKREAGQTHERRAVATSSPPATAGMDRGRPVGTKTIEQ